MIKNIFICCFIFLFILWFEYYYLLQNGNIGVIGYQGPVGINGSTGINGQNGITTNFIPNINTNFILSKIGPSGLIGINGLSGPMGPIGFRGPQGLQGQSGNNGPIGLIGPTGLTGLQGPPGKDVDWHLSIIDKNNCSEPVYNEILGYSSCPENSVMIGLENDYNKYKIKCCNLTNDVELQNSKYEMIKKGLSPNPLNIYEY